MHKAFPEALQATIRRLVADGKTVLVIGEAAHFPQYDWSCSIKALKLPLDCQARFSYRRPVPDTSNDALRQLVTEAGARYIDFNDIICAGGVCSPYDGKVPLYFDAYHISLPGSWHLGRKAVEPRAFRDFFGRERNAQKESEPPPASPEARRNGERQIN